jgi:hypothetical protein
MSSSLSRNVTATGKVLGFTSRLSLSSDSHMPPYDVPPFSQPDVCLYAGQILA